LLVIISYLFKKNFFLIDDEPTSDFRVPFVRGGTILNDRSYETELRSTPNFYSSSPIQVITFLIFKKFPINESGWLSIIFV